MPLIRSIRTGTKPRVAKQKAIRFTRFRRSLFRFARFGSRSDRSSQWHRGQPPDPEPRACDFFQPHRNSLVDGKPRHTDRGASALDGLNDRHRNTPSVLTVSLRCTASRHSLLRASTMYWSATSRSASTQSTSTSSSRRADTCRFQQEASVD